jgi:N-methylhydantoinase B
MEAEERVVLSLPGGGGYGKPSEREPDRVAHDVENGLVSTDRAGEAYGVVVKGKGSGSYVPDSGATARLRAVWRRGRLSTRDKDARI